MSRKKWSISENLLFLTPLLFVGVAAAMVYLSRSSRSLEAVLESFSVSTSNTRGITLCHSQMKQIGLAMSMYTQDYDQRFPPVGTNTFDYGWAALMNPYLMRQNGLFHCPQISGVISSPTAPNYTDYFYNARLTQVRRSALSSESFTLLIGEGASSNARSAQTQLPSAWINDPNSALYRHFQKATNTFPGANYAFAAGNVHYLRPTRIRTAPATQGDWTFSIR